MDSWPVVIAFAISGCSEAPASVALSPFSQEGREVFLHRSAPTCGTCHVLKDARTRGGLGPDLDALELDAARVRQAVIEGLALMPSQKGVLTAEQIEAVVAYVLEATDSGTAETPR